MLANNDCPKWYLAQLKPNSHRIAERHLERQGFESFLPYHGSTRRLRRQFKTQNTPLFPGYIFVRFDPQRGHWRKINSTQGITRLVQFGAAPEPVPNTLVEQLMARCDEDAVLAPSTSLSVGDVVTLTQGPFAEFVATVETLPDDQRVWVLLDLMGRGTRLAVPVGALRAV